MGKVRFREELQKNAKDELKELCTSFLVPVKAEVSYFQFCGAINPQIQWWRYIALFSAIIFRKNMIL